MTHDHDGQDDEDFPLADHPEYTGPKAGDADMNRARDLRHLDVTGGVRPVSNARVVVSPETQEAMDSFRKESLQKAEPISTGIPADHPVMKAWAQYRETSGIAVNDGRAWQLFLAGWSARDAKGE